MAESSILWTTNGVGDGLVGGYPEGTVRNWERATWTADPTLQGVSRQYLAELSLTNPAGLNLSMNTGGAVVMGFEYWNTTPVVIPLVLPVINTTGWRWVLRADWVLQTVRAVLLQSADGVAAPPGVTQIINVTWEISIFFGDITVGGIITINDDRNYLKPCIEIDNVNMQDRTRSELIQAVQATSAGVVLVRSQQPGWTCTDAVTTNCYGNFRIPEDADLTQPFLVIPVWARGVGGGAGNVDITTTASFGNPGENWNTHIMPTNVVIATVAAVIIVTAAGSAVDIQPQVDALDFVSLHFERDGGAGGDTATCDIFFMGWLLQYTRDH